MSLNVHGYRKIGVVLAALAIATFVPLTDGQASLIGDIVFAYLAINGAKGLGSVIAEKVGDAAARRNGGGSGDPGSAKAGQS